MTRYTPTGAPAVPPSRAVSLRAISRSTLELAGLTGIALRLYRTAILTLESMSSWPVFIGALLVGVVFVCGVLTWHLSNFPIKSWARRVALFVAIEVIAEFGMSSVLIAIGREPLGTGLATWADWWPLAGQTLLERVVVLGGYAGLLAGAMWVVTRRGQDQK